MFYLPATLKKQTNTKQWKIVTTTVKNKVKATKRKNGKYHFYIIENIKERIKKETVK